MNNLVLSIISGIISILITPLIRKFAIYIKVIDIPKDKRRVHNKPIPLLGGLAIYISFIITLIIKRGSISRSEKGIILGATMIVIGGMLDDKYDIKPWQKLIFQTGAAVCLLVFNVRIVSLTNPFSSGSIPYLDVGWLFGVILTIIWVVGVTNAFNLIDGLDGLAAGIAFISSATILVVGLLNKRYEAVALTSILCGAVLGFIPYNFNPASIFMGDTGSQLLGFLLAAISIEGAVKSAAAFAIAVPILALGLPIYDTLFAMVRRKINGKPIMQADRGHLHHRLLDMGLTQRQAVLVMYLISAALGGFAIIATQLSSQSEYFLLILVMSVLVFFGWKMGFFKHDNRK